MRKLIAPLLLALLACNAPVMARDHNPFITSKDINLISLLPPPPTNDSAQTKTELAEILSLQVTRTPAMIVRAQADTQEDIWRFAEVIGPKFTPAQLPLFTQFFERVQDSEGAVVDTYKKVWQRPRPFDYSELVKPAVKLSHSGAYPSGHATGGFLLGTVLADMIPEKRAEIMARAVEYGNNRLVGGVHYRSDVEAGRLTGAIIAARLQTRDDYRVAFEAAKKEIRDVLQLGNDSSPP